MCGKAIVFQIRVLVAGFASYTSIQYWRVFEMKVIFEMGICELLSILTSFEPTFRTVTDSRLRTMEKFCIPVF